MMLNSRESVLTNHQNSLMSYWTSICRDGRLPTRRDINPVQLGGALANTSLVEKTGWDFRFRLTGSRINALFGGDRPDELLEKIDASIEEAGTSSMELALETGRPVSGSRQVGARWHFWLRIPLLDDEGQRTLVLCLDEFPSRPPVTDVSESMAERIVA